MRYPHIRSLFLLAAACLLLAACELGGSVAAPTATPLPVPTPTPIPTPTPTPSQISARIGQATQGSQSVHFTIALSGKPVFADESGLFEIVGIVGDLKRPDGVLATLKVGGAAGSSEIKTVSLAGKQYFTNPITLGWQCLPAGEGFDPAVLFDPSKGVENLLQQGFQNVSLIGMEEIAGVPSYHLRGSFAAAALQAISGSRLGAGDVKVDLWADAATMRASKIELVDTASDPNTPSIWTITFSDYDKPVDVRVPPGVSC
jgi:lipoprotein LprG